MNEQLWFFGLIAEVGSGQTPIIFHYEPLEVEFDGVSFNVLKDDYKILNNLLKTFPKEGIEQWSQSSAKDKENSVIYTLLSRSKERVETAIKASELVLRLVGNEIERERIEQTNSSVERDLVAP